MSSPSYRGEGGLSSHAVKVEASPHTMKKKRKPTL